jgi:hypothetical protein
MVQLLMIHPDVTGSPLSNSIGATQEVVAETNAAQHVLDLIVVLKYNIIQYNAMQYNTC